MKKIIISAAFLALAACGSEAEEPQPVETAAAVAPPVEPSLPAPNEEIFAQTFANACPNAEPVNSSFCRSQGFGETDFMCEYALGDEEVRRKETVLTPGDGEWMIANPEETCAA